MGQNHLRLRAASVASNSEKFYHIFTDRNLGILTAKQQKIISETRVAQAGIGGNSDVILTMAQLGFQHFTVADPDIYELSNFNRQMGADLTSLGKKKVHHIRDLLHMINPWAEVRVLPEGVTEENLNSFLENAQIVIEAIDSQAAHMKNRLVDTALERGMPVFTCPSPGWGAVLLFFDPEGSPSMTELVGVPPSERFLRYTRDDLGFRWALYFARMNYLFLLRGNGLPEGVIPELYTSRSATPVISPACRLRAALVSSTILKWLFRQENLPCAPSVVHYDLFSNTVAIIKRTMQEYKRGLEHAEQVFIDTWEPYFSRATQP
nr:ThiF family adenylyltransferase [Candidatus Njordarchaeum guaymaensis]